jgi:glutamate 5-kinase
MSAKKQIKQRQIAKRSERQDKSIYHRVIVKLGTNLLTAGTDHLDLGIMASLVGQIAELQHQGFEVIIVSSGAIAAGRHKIGHIKERKDIPFKQVLASIGQTSLMQSYEQLFSWHDIVVAQALLTKEDISDRAGYLNARNTLLALLELRVLPIVNENDVVAIDEIKELKFGDNDNLSAMVANLVDADLLIMLGVVDGLYTVDPNIDPEARLISRIDKIDKKIEKLASGTISFQGTGGVYSKIQAAKLATSSGVSVIIANGRERNIVTRLVDNESIGTLLPALTSKLESRKRWMLSGLGSRGVLSIDAGAITALKKRKGSLLPAGITQIRGEFIRGDVIDIIDTEGSQIARGITNYNSHDIQAIKGVKSDKIISILGYEYGAEVVHRNNLVDF